MPNKIFSQGVSHFSAFEGLSKRRQTTRGSNKGNLVDVPKESPMITARQAQDLTGIGAGQLLLLALTHQIPSQRDPDTRLVLFDPAILQEWTQANGRNLSTHPSTLQ